MYSLCIEKIIVAYLIIKVASFRSSSREIEIAYMSSFNFFINFSLRRRLKFMQEHNLFCYIFSLEHRLFSISPLLYLLQHLLL